MLSIFFTTLYVLICALLLVVVLMQQGKGGGLQAAFGGSGSEAAFGARAGASVLTRATTVLGALFMVGSMTLAIMGQRGDSSIISGVEGPGFQPPTPATAAVEIEPEADGAAGDAENEPTPDTSEGSSESPAEPQ